MNLMYYELNEMTDDEMLNYVSNKVENGEDFMKAHVMVYGALCNRHGDNKAYEMMGVI